MAIKKITDEEIRNAQIQGNLPNRPTQKSLYPENTLTAEEVKAAFDKLPKLVAERYNQLVQAIVGTSSGTLNADSLASMMQTGIREGHTLKDLFQEIINGELQFLPNISKEDNEKILTVENGEWIVKHLMTKDELPYFFIGTSGKIGDNAIYQRIMKDKLHLFYVTDDDTLVLMTPSGLQDDSNVLLFKGMILSKKEGSITLYQITLSPDQSWSLTEIPISETGANGKSAYEIALEYGFKGSEEEWLASLKVESEILEKVTSADNGKVLSVESGKAKWVDIDPLPSVTMNDDGKYLLVEDGEWVAKHFSVSGDYMLEGTNGFFIKDEETFGRIVRGEMPLKLVAESGNIVELFPASKSGSWDTYYFIGTETHEENNTLTGYFVTVLDADLSWRLTSYSFPLHVNQTLAWHETHLFNHDEHLESHDKDIADLKGSEEQIYAIIDDILLQQPTEGGTSATRQYVTLRNDSEGTLEEEELSILQSEENGIRYVIEESTNSSRIYYCHLSENTKTKKTYVSCTFTGQSGSASYIIIQVDQSGNWYKRESTYKGFLTPTAADSGKVLTVHTNGTPIWLNSASARQHITISGKTTGTLSDAEYAVICESDSYIEYIYSGVTYHCFFTKETNGTKDFVSGVYRKNGVESCRLIQVNSQKSFATLEYTVKGTDGTTPVKGVDYFTEADKAELVSALLANFTDASEVAL